MQHRSGLVVVEVAPSHALRQPLDGILVGLEIIALPSLEGALSQGGASLRNNDSQLLYLLDAHPGGLLVEPDQASIIVLGPEVRHEVNHTIIRFP